MSEVEIEPPLCVLVKTSPDEDLYVGWGYGVDDVVGIWNRSAALKAGFSADRLYRADKEGSSSLETGGKWTSSGFVVLGMFWLDRDRIGEYALAAASGDKIGMARCFSMVDDDTPEEFEAKIASFLMGLGES